MAKKGQKFEIKEEELILKVVKEKLKGKTYYNLSKQYSIPMGTIMTWVKRYKDKGYVAREKKGIRKKPENMTIEELRIENEILKKFQAFLKEQQKKR